MNRSRLTVSFACVLFLCAGALLCAGGAASAPSESAFAQQDIDPDDVLMSVTIEEGGDAVWTIEYRTRLETDEDERAFAELKRDVDADSEPYAERFQGRMDRTAAGAENATGREMTISEMTVSAENRTLPQEYGVLSYRFRWSNFAAVDGDRLFVGDAIDGLFLDEETSLLLSWSDGYELLEASPEPTETRTGSAVYEGPSDFAGGEPRLELGPVGSASTDAGTGSDTGAELSPRVSIPTLAAFAALVLLGVAAAFVVFWRRGEAADISPEERDGGATHVDSVATTTNAELLSNEEQVLRLVESEGGRMKQKAVAEQLEWTDAKTSQVTKRLRESGELDGFRLGRENVLSLSEADPDATSDSK